MPNSTIIGSISTPVIFALGQSFFMILTAEPPPKPKISEFPTGTPFALIFLEPAPRFFPQYRRTELIPPPGLWSPKLMIWLPEFRR